MASRRAGRPGPDPRKVARALVLRRPPHDKTLAEIAQELGVSTETARNWVLLAENAERWLPAYDRAMIAANIHGVLLNLQYRGLRALDEPDADYSKITPALVGVLRLMVDIHGLKAPARVNISTNAEPAEPDPAMMAAIRAAIDTEAADRAALDSGSDPDGQ